MNELLPTEEAAPVITFYSYKGGVGRSMAVLNVATLLASRGFRVLIIDFDLEAPGLSHLVERSAKKSKPIEKIPPPNGVIDLLLDARQRQENSDLFRMDAAALAAKYTFRYPIPSDLHPAEDACLTIMPAGRLGEGYATRLDELNLPHLYDKPPDAPAESMSQGQKFILAFKAILTRSGAYDYIIVDSRTGHSDEAGICTRDLADHRMVLSGLNTQNISGTAGFLKGLRKIFEKANIPFITPDIILSPVPSSEEELISRRLNAAAREFKHALGTKPELDLFIPYHPRLALTEEAYVPSLPTSALRQAYLRIETRLLHSINHRQKQFMERFTKLIESAKGDKALKLLQHLLKLQGTPGVPASRIFDRIFPYFLPAEKIYPLAESLDILTLIAKNLSSDYGLLEITKKFHLANEVQAAAFSKILLELPSLSSEFLGDYANFLTYTRKDHDAAEDFFIRSLEINPRSAQYLGDYAIFLSQVRKNHSTADDFFKRALEIDPTNSFVLGAFANFLTQIRKDHNAADALYKRSLEINPKDTFDLSNYGHFLVVRERLTEGISYLRLAWENRDDDNDIIDAALAYCLWLSTCLNGAEELNWERVFKHYIVKGFIRNPWNFDDMLLVAKEKLDPQDFDYSQALAVAFLDDTKVADLERFPRWQNLRPLYPDFVESDGSEGGLF